jgi:lipopolysaccharide transport system permease protein
MTTVPEPHPAATPPRLHTRIHPARSWQFPDLREMARFRELLVTLAGRDLKVRYKQTALGIVWVVFQPLAAAAIFTALRFFFQLPTPGNIPNVLFVLSAYVGFTLAKDILAKSSTSLVDNGNLVSKIYFPRALLPLGTTLSCGFDHLVALVMFVLVWIACAVLYGPMGFGDPATQVPGFGWHLLMWPVCTLLMTMLALGIGMMATALASYYRDVKHVIPVVLQLATFATPVFYDLAQPLSDQTPRWFEWLYLANPLAGLIPAYRWSLTGVGTVHWGGFAYAAGLAVGALLVGSLIFRRVEGRVADVL